MKTARCPARNSGFMRIFKGICIKKLNPVIPPIRHSTKAFWAERNICRILKLSRMNTSNTNLPGVLPL